MPGAPHFLIGGNYTEQGAGKVEPANGSHWGFMFWLIVIGVLFPAAVLGGLQLGGFSFVFKHR